MGLDMAWAEDEYVPFSRYQAFVTLGVFYVPLALASIRTYFSWKLSPKSKGYIYQNGLWARLVERFGPPTRTYADGMVLMLLLIGSCYTVSWCFGQNAGKIYRLIAYLDNSPGEEVWVIGRREFELVDAPAIAVLGDDAKKLTHLEVSPISHPEQRMAFISQIAWDPARVHKEIRLRVHSGLMGVRWHSIEDVLSKNIHYLEARLPGDPLEQGHLLEKYHGKVLVFVDLERCDTRKPAPEWLQVFEQHANLQLFRSGNCEPSPDKSSPWFVLTTAPTANVQVAPYLTRTQSVVVLFVDPFGFISNRLENDQVTSDNISREIAKASIIEGPYGKQEGSHGSNQY